MCKEVDNNSNDDKVQSDNIISTNAKEMIDMSKIDKSNITGLTKEKKELMKKLMGSASSEYINLNKIREELRNESN